VVSASSPLLRSSLAVHKSILLQILWKRAKFPKNTLYQLLIDRQLSSWEAIGGPAPVFFVGKAGGTSAHSFRDSFLPPLTLATVDLRFSSISSFRGRARCGRSNDAAHVSSATRLEADLPPLLGCRCRTGAHVFHETRCSFAHLRKTSLPI